MFNKKKTGTSLRIWTKACSYCLKEVCKLKNSNVTQVSGFAKDLDR